MAESAHGLPGGPQVAQPQHSAAKVSTGGFRWLVIFLLFYITVTNYIDRSAIAFATSDIKTELGLGPAEIGLILGAFGLGYAVTTFLGGVAVDQWGARTVLLAAAVMWTASIGVTGFAGGFLTLYIARTVLGIAEGPNFPALTGAVSRWLAPHERHRAWQHARRRADCAGDRRAGFNTADLCVGLAGHVLRADHN